eukprot:TRINITY_DN23897_c0_g1_i12.p1 TRINITY_DN23897_c0_g1~~TRINITY_DN23897_c0_g1_i12.p1  ORF type:complete len:319 (-),score=64.76 TRINITY_DN23897_c0_g1_i12:163-1119(-)
MMEEKNTENEKECLNNLSEDDHQKPALSKRQMKKAEKRRLWLETKSERRKEEKERRKRKMERIKEERGGFQESRSASRKRLKREQVKLSESACKVGVVFDMQFGELMHQRDLGKCIKQILRCYSQNRRLKAPLQMHMTSLRDSVLQEMEKHNGYKAWDMHFHEDSFDQVLPKDSLVYLSGDSQNELETLENGKNYIIGGLVDHNNHKGICLRKAEELGIAHARLPIGKYVAMKTRHILAVNHVYEIMVQVTLEKTWKDAFFHVIPSRKGINNIENSSQAEETSENTQVKIEDIKNAESDNNGDQEKENNCDITKAFDS